MSASVRCVDERVMEPNDLPNLNSREGASCTLWCTKFGINLNSRERVMSFMYEKCAVGVVYMSFLLLGRFALENALLEKLLLVLLTTKLSVDIDRKS